jgi:2-alkyl-3-oxoalkanoate reductase
MRTVLITGANGFIGSHLCDAFLGAGYRVYGLVRKTSDLRFISGANITMVQGDLRAPEQIAFPESVDVIVHAAALVSDNATITQTREHVYGITRRLVEEALRRYPRLSRFVYISSALTLGICADNISERAPGRSADFLPYGLMKKTTEEYLLDLHRSDGFPVVILRPGDVYGPRDRTSSEQMLRAAEKGVPLRVGRGRSKFGFCAPANLCRAAIAASERPSAVGEAYVVVNGVAPTWREFFGALQEGVGRPQHVYVPVSVLMMAAFGVELLKRMIPGLRPAINYYRIRRITTQTTYDGSRAVRELGYDSDDDYRSQFRAIVEWYQQEKARSFA